MSVNDDFPMIRPVPYMGVIWVVHEASKLGFWNGHPDWCNLGQGQPEVGDMEGAPPRIKSVTMKDADQAYGPLGGSDEMREIIASTYNRLYRRGMKSQYTAKNISFAGGGRLALTRLFATFADGSRVLYKSPDYTAYEDYLAYHKARLTLVPVMTREEDGFSLPPDALEACIRRQNINAYVFSNPCNPTGEAVMGKDLERYVESARENKCLLGCDEFYSHFIYNEDGSPASGPVSAAAYVEDVNKDPVLLVDGLTKSHRYPGWRAGWIAGPEHVIEMVNRAASALDGGPSLIVQRAAMEALDPERYHQETTAMRRGFAKKRRLMLERLKAMGITPAAEPRGTFYIWATIRDLPAPLNDGDAFFHACLQEKVMTVPGRFFDVRPLGVRDIDEPFGSWVRFSYGPPEAVVETGLSRIEKVIAQAR
ncbi:pyridoxal phosphate-dependent aminotransferase [Desulfovibrio sp. OttesenSCG-928-I05]|nr:pyridoxal phosphate-dependent aminotransferase [Desulfovibrio sp. OttesenSCG-928-I05]